LITHETHHETRQKRSPGYPLDIPVDDLKKEPGRKPT
jgi:hypothetical protein